jgi:hypothetical protein
MLVYQRVHIFRGDQNPRKFWNPVADPRPLLKQQAPSQEDVAEYPYFIWQVGRVPIPSFGDLQGDWNPFPVVLESQSIYIYPYIYIHIYIYISHHGSSWWFIESIEARITWKVCKDKWRWYMCKPCEESLPRGTQWPLAQYWVRRYDVFSLGAFKRESMGIHGNPNFLSLVSSELSGLEVDFKEAERDGLGDASGNLGLEESPYDSVVLMTVPTIQRCTLWCHQTWLGGKSHGRSSN